MCNPIPIVRSGWILRHALRIKNLIDEKYGKNYSSEDLEDKLIFELLKEAKANLNYWEKIQIEGLVG